MSTKQEIKDAQRYIRDRYNIYMMYFCGIFHNSVKFNNLPKDLPKRYLLRVLLRKGYIINYGSLYLPGFGEGVNVYGLPERYVITSYNGEVIMTVNAKNCTVLRVNDQGYPLYPYLKQQSLMLANIDAAINQNLEACKTMTVFECADQATLLSLQNLSTAKSIGAAKAFVNKSFSRNISVNALETGAEYLCDQFIQLRKEYMNETLSRLGIMSANVDKRERVQSAEVNATVGEVVDNIHVMIDTFNYDAEIGGLDIRMELNTKVEEYYALNKEIDNAD